MGVPCQPKEIKTASQQQLGQRKKEGRKEKKGGEKEIKAVYWMNG